MAPSPAMNKKARPSMRTLRHSWLQNVGSACRAAGSRGRAGRKAARQHSNSSRGRQAAQEGGHAGIDRLQPERSAASLPACYTSGAAPRQQGQRNVINTRDAPFHTTHTRSNPPSLIWMHLTASAFEPLQGPTHPSHLHHEDGVARRAQLRARRRRRAAALSSRQASKPEGRAAAGLPQRCALCRHAARREAGGRCCCGARREGGLVRLRAAAQRLHERRSIQFVRLRQRPDILPKHLLRVREPLRLK